MQNFSFLACLEIAERFVVVEWWGGPDQVKGSALVKLNNYTQPKILLTRDCKLEFLRLGVVEKNQSILSVTVQSLWPNQI